MAELGRNILLTLSVRKRWWFSLAYTVGYLACFLHLLTEDRAKRYIDWLVRKGMRMEAI